MTKDRSTFTAQINELQRTPSVQSWEQEIESLLTGKRDHAVLRLGGVQEYIEVLLARSENPETTLSTFHEALRNVIQRWQPSRPSSQYYLSGILDLIGAYTPSAGFIKVLGHILQGGQFGRNIEGSLGSDDLHLKALIVLRNYFPAPPPSVQDELGFSSYVNMLRELLGDLDYANHALRRLIELEILQTNDQEVIDTIRSNIRTIPDLVTLFLLPSWRQRAPRNLALIYMYASSTGEEVDEIFAKAAALNRARFEPLLPPVIAFETGEVIKFYFTLEEMEKYSRLSNREARVQEIAQAISQNREFSKADELIELLEDTLDNGKEEVKRFQRAIDRSGLYLAHGRVGPYLYLPHEVVIPLTLKPEFLEKYLLSVRFGEEPIRDMETFYKQVRVKAAGGEG